MGRFTQNLGWVSERGRGLSVLIVLLSLLSLHAGAAGQETQCRRVPDAVDGSSIRGVWDTLSWQTLTNGPEFAPRDAHDISAQAAIAWNLSFLFVAARVEDDIFYPSDSGPNFWRGDSIQFAFAPKGAAPFFVGAADLTFGPRVIPTDVPDGYPDDLWNVPFEVKHDGSRVTYVVAVPWRYLGALNPLSDEEFGFNIIVNDNDGGGRRGWLQISDGIGDGSDASKFRLARFVRDGNQAPEIHVRPNSPKIKRAEGIRLLVSTRNAEPGMTVRATADGQKREASCAGGEATLDFAGGTFAVGDLPVKAELLDPSGKVIARAETGVTILDPEESAGALSRARAVLAQTDSLIEQARAKHYAVDYVQIRANCLRHALKVADLAEKGYTDEAGARVTFPRILDRVVSYVKSAAPALLSDAEKLAGGSPEVQFAVPQPDLLQPWTIREGNLYAGNSPIILNGFIWTYNAKDASYSLQDFGLNTQSLETGPRSVTDAPFRLADDLMGSDLIASCRKRFQDSGKMNEAADLLLSPHYTPGWFEEVARGLGESDSMYGWMDTDEGRRLLDLSYQGISQAYGDIDCIKTVDIANEWIFYSTSPRSMSLFRGWLARRHGTVGKLNAVWKTSYRGFGEVPAPFTGTRAMAPEGVYKNRAPYWDWCCFNTERAARVLTWMDKAVRRYFPGKYTHVKCILSSREAKTFAQDFVLGIDPQKTLPVTDIIGTDASYIVGDTWKGTLFAYDYMKSICPDKPIFCSEMHVMPYGDPTPLEIRRGLFQRVVHGERMNVLFLNTMLQGPEWWTEGKHESAFNISQAPDSFESFAVTSADLRRLAPELFRFAKRKPTIALFYDNAADFGVPGGDPAPGEYGTRLLKVYESLLPTDTKVGIVTESMLAKGLPAYPLIVFAGSRFVSDATVTALKGYLERGGRLLLIGDNFRFDHYGRRRATGALSFLAASKRVIRLPQGECHPDWAQVLGAAGVKPRFSMCAANGQPMSGIELLSTSDADGRYLVFLANTGWSEVRGALKCPGRPGAEFVDMITGQRVDAADVRLLANQVVLLKEVRKQ